MGLNPSTPQPTSCKGRNGMEKGHVLRNLAHPALEIFQENESTLQWVLVINGLDLRRVGIICGAEIPVTLDGRYAQLVFLRPNTEVAV